jgi:hypothetical protein
LVAPPRKGGLVVPYSAALRGFRCIIKASVGSRRYKISVLAEGNGFTRDRKFAYWIFVADVRTDGDDRGVERHA